MPSRAPFPARLIVWLRSIFGRKPDDAPPFVPPFVGEFRTRPRLSPLPEAPEPKKKHLSWKERYPRAELVVLFLLSVAFVSVGALMSARPRAPADRMWGILSICFFGLGAWTFGEQFFARARDSYSRGATARILVALFLSGLGVLYGAWTTPAAGLLERLGAGVFGVLFLGLSVGSAVVAYRNGRLPVWLSKRRRLSARPRKEASKRGA